MIGNVMVFAGSEVEIVAPQTAQPAARDETDFADLYKRYASMVHGIILARVPYSEVDDIAQEVFLSAYKQFGSLRDPDAVGAWLGTIARNQVVAYYRRRRTADELNDHVATYESRGNEAGEILAAIQALPLAYAETLVLRLVEGMTGPEIAERTGLTPESVRVNLHRGMKLLRQKLGVTE